MKKIFYYGAFIALISGTFISCNKEKIVIPTDNNNIESSQQNVNKIDQQNIYYVNLTDAQKFAEFEKMGQNHNVGVEYVYNYINNRKTANSTINQLYLISEQGSLAYLNSLGTNTDPYTQELYTNVSNTFTTTPVDISNFTDLYNSTSITQSQKNYISQLENILNQGGTVKSVTISINNIENQALVSLSNEEEVLVLSLMSVCKYSYQYWTTNKSKWLTLITTTDNPTPSPAALDPKKVAKADGKGAAAGTAAWGAGAIFGGPVTWSAWAISTAGWAVGCSVY